MEERYFNQIASTIIFGVLLVLTFLILKPILISVITGLILAYIFTPVFKYLNKYISSKDLVASIICVFLVLIILLSLWFLTPIFINQSVKFYLAAQQIDLVAPLKTLFPSFFSSDVFSEEIGSITQIFLTNTSNYLVKSFSEIILNFPTLFLQLLVVVFTFYFVLRDGEVLINYIKTLLPFSKEVEKKLFQYSEGITSSVIYGQVVIGFIQGVVAGIGFFIFRVPNALLLTFFACLAGIFPITGTTIIWAPVAIYLFIGGNSLGGLGVIAFGLIAVFIDNFIRPVIVSKRTQMNSSIILISMIGGLFLFGILGFILGPLIVAYLMVLLELYRTKRTPGYFIQQPSS